jgi:hypothetical protein
VVLRLTTSGMPLLPIVNSFLSEVAGLLSGASSPSQQQP